MPEPGGVADAVVAAIHSGDLPALRQLLADHPGVVNAPLGGRYQTRRPLSAVADWPGYFPNGPEIVRMLVEAGAEPDAGVVGDETPLHWAASSDDWHVAAALIDAGADINAPDGSIGTPLANAVGYGCWDVARLLVARGADVDRAWIAAALGLLDQLEQLLGEDPPPEQVSQSFWHACGAPSAGRRSTCWPAGPTSIGFPTTRGARLWTRRPGREPSARTSSDGSANAEPAARSPTARTPTSEQRSSPFRRGSTGRRWARSRARGVRPARSA